MWFVSKVVTRSCLAAAAGCSAYAGIPLTHRECAHTVRFITGHAKQGGVLNYDWTTLADGQSTIVIYMGLATLERVTGALMIAGLPGDTPAAVVENGTTAEQRRVIATVSTLVQEVGRADFRPPALVIIGRVVALADTIDWFHPLGRGRDDALPAFARGSAG